MKQRRYLTFAVTALATLLLGLAVWPVPAAQSTPEADAAGGTEAGVVDFGHGDDLSPDAERAIAAQIGQNQARLYSEGRLQRPAQAAQTLFAWPLRPANGLTDPVFHGIGAFVDHDPATPNHLLDYNGGTRTYDLSGGYNHQGTDIFIWPFSWLRMQNDQVQVVAAAPGVIVLRVDGNYDHNCGITGATANAIFVQHADGSVAWYFHLKKNSLTPKIVGDSVVTGEYLGVVGSSGDSTGPHLHFEIHDAQNALIDPWYGPSNPSVSSSWWNAQLPYYDSALNHLATTNITPTIPACPQTESPHETDQFAPGSRIYFAAYFHDERQGQLINYQILRPNGNLYTSGTNDLSVPFAPASYRYWYYTFPADLPQGLWHFKLTYLGQTHDLPFRIGGKVLYLPAVQR